MKQKKQKFKSAKRLLLPHEAFTLQSSHNHGLEISYAIARLGSRFGNRFRNAPTTAQPTIVLPALARSFFADGKNNKKKFVILSGSEESNRVLFMVKRCFVPQHDKYLKRRYHENPLI